ncbi:hypothetical protein KI387_026316 [Taxus chinensis]|uniref:SHSP domain-containing protein n=1 Tax=Taxus chinensis TaxID=29808 RepID=A0AA38FVG5_TAXCH|nr:hypothetical protein KI387_026316 [Taxus chinensis]
MDLLLSTLLGVSDEMEKHINAPTRTYICDTKAMASTPADVKEYPNSYVFVVDIPGLKSNDIKVQVEDKNVLTISEERKREDNREAKFIRMEHSLGKIMRKFALPDNCNLEAISATCHDRVLSVVVPKLSPHEPAKGVPPMVKDLRTFLRLS